MSSLKQIEANRGNALKSTGPTTQEGKERSRCNAVRHGLTAETVIADLEDAADYQAFEAAVIADYDAQTAVERELVLRLASVLWRLRRATGIEASLFEFAAAEPSKSETHLLGLTLIGRVDLENREQPSQGAAGSLNDFAITAGSLDPKNIAKSFLRLAAQATFPLDRLSRYEHTLWRQARQLVFTLESLRRRQHAPQRFRFPFRSPERP